MRRANRLLSALTFIAVLWSLWRVGHAMSLIYSMSAHQPMPGFGWYAFGVLGVLVAHEGGHAAAAWWIGLVPGWPLFFPWPLPVAAWLGWPWLPAFGTLGAWLPIPGLSRRAGGDQWWVAMTGLVAGFAVSVVLVGLGSLLAAPVSGPHVWSLLPVPWLMTVLVPKGVIWHPAMVAGWLGLLLTGLNLIPIPGFDGWKIWAYWDDLSTGQKWGSILAGGAACACLPVF